MSQGAPAFERVERDRTTTLLISGEIDLACIDELREQLQAVTANASSTGVVDLSGVTFLDSSATDADLALAHPSDVCRSVLSLSGADQFFEIRE
jgi:ABC-type transporter Mla MlaB component